MDDELFEMANGLTYRVLLAFFPFLIFLMSLLGFMQLDDSAVLDSLYRMLPEDIYKVISGFLKDVNPTRNHGLLSFSLVFTVYATANGFRAVIFCINKAYDYREERSILKTIGISVTLMFIFTLALLIMLFLLIFGGFIWELARPLLPDTVETLYLYITMITLLIILVAVTMLIYKLACVRKLRFMNVLPGAVVTVMLWVLFSRVFGYFVSNFTNYSLWYGSIASIFILILWLDIISLILLLGNQINSMLVPKQ
jgi:membrane protein